MYWIMKVPVIRLLLKILLVITIVVLMVFGFFSLLRNRLPSLTRLKSISANTERRSDSVVKHMDKGHEPMPNREKGYLSRLAAEKRKAGKGGAKRRSRTKLDVIVVEEHHEVLPYWFGLANKQNKLANAKVRRSKQHPSYTVVHFDGHSDFGPMSYKPKLPLFEWPKSGTDITRLMQRNDVFVMAAVGSGLVKRFVWVWPHWAGNVTGPAYGNHTSGQVSLGTFTYGVGDGLSKTGMCICMTETHTDGKPSMPLTDPAGRNCLFAKPELEPYEKLDVQCSFKVKKIRFDYVKDEYMLNNVEKVLRQKPKGKSKDHLILDFDEDYFGCEKGSDPLIKAGINWATIVEMNSRLRQLFCPRSAKHEQQLSVVIPSLLQSNCTSPLESTCSATSRSEFAAVKRTGCPGVKNLQSKIRSLRKFVNRRLSSEQLEILLSKVGFCMGTSPKTARIAIGKERNPMTVCVGANEPQSKNSEYYTPTKEVLTLDMKRLKYTLDKISRVKLVTIARSNRDGYVPRAWQAQIEKGLVDIVKDYCVNHHKSPHLIYDKDLMKSRPSAECAM